LPDQKRKINFSLAFPDRPVCYKESRYKTPQ